MTIGDLMTVAKVGSEVGVPARVGTTVGAGVVVGANGKVGRERGRSLITGLFVLLVRCRESCFPLG